MGVESLLHRAGIAAGRDASMTQWAEGEWIAVHLHCGSSLHGASGDQIVDRVVRSVMHNLSPALYDGWFFIRYSDGGPHIRLRIHARDLRETVQLREQVSQHLTLFEKRSARPRDPHSQRDSLSAPTLLGDVRWCVYEPELIRYGGRWAMRVVETAFQLSSILTLSELPLIRGTGRSYRLGRGMLSSLVTANVFLKDAAAASTLFRRWFVGYLRSAEISAHVEQVTERFEHSYRQQAHELDVVAENVWTQTVFDKPISGALDTFRDGMRQMLRRLERLFSLGTLQCRNKPAGSVEEASVSILPSLVHMHNNRLGITVVEEAYLAYLIQRMLGGPAVADVKRARDA